MEKLIDLLNEYEKDKIKDSEGLDVMYVWKYEGTLHYYDNYKDENVFDNVRLLIISKGYEFIKWLVDNDKIDRDKIIEKSDFMPIVSDKFGDFLQPTEEQELLMLLSISDTPIEDLISYLKIS